jgi:hypothetical protein
MSTTTKPPVGIAAPVNATGRAIYGEIERIDAVIGRMRGERAELVKSYALANTDPVAMQDGNPAPAKPHGLSAAGRKAISQATKARHAKERREKAAALAKKSHHKKPAEKVMHAGA